jgi:hypothetical protein
MPAAAPAATSTTAASNGSAAEGVSELKRLLIRAGTRRWPMFPRNVKQIIRQVSPSFDERAYGFGSLVDLLRAAQKEGVVRVERDRRGGIRVFEGPQLAAAAKAPAAIEVEPSHEAAPVVVVDVEVLDEVVEPVEPVVIDAPVVAEADAQPEADVVEAVEAPAPRRRRSPRRATTRRAASAR